MGEGNSNRRDTFTVMKSGKVLINGKQVKLKSEGETETIPNRRLDERHTELKAELDAAHAKIAALEAKQTETEQMIAAIVNHVGHKVAAPRK